MSESASHTALVGALKLWIADRVPNGIVLLDSAGVPTGDRPPSILGYVPDAYVAESAGAGPLIGEAKTSKDIERPHSQDQYRAFIEWCAYYKDSLFVLAVPWDQVRAAANLLRCIQKKTGTEAVNTHVIRMLCV